VFVMGGDYWKGMLDWMHDRMVGGGFIRSEDMDLFTVSDDPVEVADGIKAWWDANKDK